MPLPNFQMQNSDFYIGRLLCLFNIIFVDASLRPVFFNLLRFTAPLRPKKNLAAPQHAKKWLSEVSLVVKH